VYYCGELFGKSDTREGGAILEGLCPYSFETEIEINFSEGRTMAEAAVTNIQKIDRKYDGRQVWVQSERKLREILKIGTCKEVNSEQGMMTLKRSHALNFFLSLALHADSSPFVDSSRSVRLIHPRGPYCAVFFVVL